MREGPYLFPEASPQGAPGEVGVEQDFKKSNSRDFKGLTWCILFWSLQMM